MKKVLIILLSLFLVIGLVLTPFALEYFDIVVSGDSSEVIIDIPQGMSTKEIGVLLKEKECIKSEYTFYLKIKGSKYEGKLNYGTFKLRKNMSLTEILEIFVNNYYVEETVKITFPEGYKFIKYIPNNDYKYKLQGFLFPSTYEFNKSVTGHEVVNEMLKTFDKRYSKLTEDYSNIFEVITRASVIEKEAKLDTERFIISGVISNRIEKDMLLQVDACVVYAVTDGLYNKGSLSYKDLEIDSLYNTYKYKGLPIGAICNPGIVSIEAALNPEDNEWLYYHTDEVKKDGSHIFTKTYDEHLKTMN